MSKVIQVSCPGSCGELFQGMIAGSEYLVTLPVELFNTVSIKRSSTQSFPQSPKLKQAFELTCEHFGLYGLDKPLVCVRHQQRLPISKGMSSSTADIVAMIHATTHLLEQSITEAEVAMICCQIERTDSLLFNQMTVMNLLTGTVMAQSQWQPKMNVLILESEDLLETVKFHQKRSQTVVAKQAKEYQKLYQLFLLGIEQQSLEKLGEVSTASSCLNQMLLPKPHFQELLAFVETYHLLGIMVAHSGSVLGFLIESEREFPKELLKEISSGKIQQAYPTYHLTQTTMGGPHFLS